MEEINLKELFDYFVSKWFMVALAAVVCVVFGAVYTIFFKTPLYNSYTTMVLTTNMIRKLFVFRLTVPIKK